MVCLVIGMWARGMCGQWYVGSVVRSVTFGVSVVVCMISGICDQWYVKWYWGVNGIHAKWYAGSFESIDSIVVGLVIWG